MSARLRRMAARLWPASLFGRLAIILFSGLVAAHVLAFVSIASDRFRDVKGRIFTPPLVFDSPEVEGNQNEGKHMCNDKAGKQDDRQPAEQGVRPKTRRNAPKAGVHGDPCNASTEAAKT